MVTFHMRLVKTCKMSKGFLAFFSAASAVGSSLHSIPIMHIQGDLCDTVKKYGVMTNSRLLFSYISLRSALHVFAHLKDDHNELWKILHLILCHPLIFLPSILPSSVQLSSTHNFSSALL